MDIDRRAFSGQGDYKAVASAAEVFWRNGFGLDDAADLRLRDISDCER